LFSLQITLVNGKYLGARFFQDNEEIKSANNISLKDS